MATYFTRWYIEFRDNHVATPITWRVDILDSEGNAPTEPYQLIAAAEPLITERMDTSEDKFTYIIGKQITVSYEYTGNASEPLPELFFEATERRFRANVYKNGVLDGTYYIKPDFSQYPDIYPPFTISLTAVDGFSYLKGIRFNAYDEDGLLFYEKTPLYDAIMTRGLNQIFDEGTVINVINTLVPNGADPGFNLLFDVSVHMDIFYDFVEGPVSVYDMLLSFCKTFKARLITDENQIWFMRIQDLNYAPYVYDRYADATTVTTVNALGFVRYVGPSLASDGIPINLSGLIRMMPAVKEANFEVNYKGINQLTNFSWRDWDGSDFDDWTRSLGSATVGRSGTGTLGDQYRALLPYSTDPGHYINQGFFTGTPFIPVQVGQIIQVEIPYRFDNTKSFAVLVVATAELSGNFVSFVLSSGGNWIEDIGVISTDKRIPLSRSGSKRDGSFKITSLPLPRAFVGGVGYPNDMKLLTFLFYPNELSDTSDGPIPNQVAIGPIKVGVVSSDSKGRHLRITNTADFSQVREEEQFTFIDTGVAGLSNSLFTGPSLTPEDGGWISPKAGVNPGDIERFMAISVIDQYQRSVNSWEGTLYSNSLNFYNMLQLLHKPFKTWMQLSDTYNNRTCEHDMLIVETFAERPTGEPPNETYNYTEWDIEEEKD